MAPNIGIKYTKYIFRPRIRQ